MTVLAERRPKEHPSNSITFELTQEIETAQMLVSLAPTVNAVLAGRGFIQKETEAEAFVWDNALAREQVRLNFYTAANSISLRRSIAPTRNQTVLGNEAETAYTDLYGIIQAVAETCGYPHLSTTIQLTFGVQGQTANSLLEVVVPTIRQIHSQRNGGVNVDVNSLESSKNSASVLFTPFNLNGE